MMSTKRNQGRGIGALAKRFLRDERGDDLVEYALLTAAIGFAGIAGLAFLQQQIGLAYQAFDDAQYAIYATPNPK